MIVRAILAVALGLGTTSNVSASVPTSNAETKSLLIFCFPFDVVSAEKVKGDDGQVRANGPKHPVGLGVAVDREFPHLSASLYDPDNLFSGFAVDYVESTPPQIGLQGRLSNGRKTDLLLRLSNDKNMESTVSIMVKQGDKVEQLWSGTCFWQPRTESFDGLSSEFTTLNNEWKASDLK